MKKRSFKRFSVSLPSEIMRLADKQAEACHRTRSNYLLDLICSDAKGNGNGNGKQSTAKS